MLPLGNFADPFSQRTAAINRWFQLKPFCLLDYEFKIFSNYSYSHSSWRKVYKVAPYWPSLVVNRKIASRTLLTYDDKWQIIKDVTHT